MAFRSLDPGSKFEVVRSKKLKCLFQVYIFIGILSATASALMAGWLARLPGNPRVRDSTSARSHGDGKYQCHLYLQAQAKSLQFSYIYMLMCSLVRCFGCQMHAQTAVARSVASRAWSCVDVCLSPEHGTVNLSNNYSLGGKYGSQIIFTSFCVFCMSILIIKIVIT